MDRRTYLKNTAALAGGILVPASVVKLVGMRGEQSLTDLEGFAGKIMGTNYSVRFGGTSESLKVQGPNTNSAANEFQARSLDGQHVTSQWLSSIAQQVHATLQQVDHQMSTWRDTSELSQFNHANDHDWRTVSANTFKVVDCSIQTSQLCVGAFDASVGPLVDLWGFGAKTNYTQLNANANKPSAKAISDCMERVGYNYIELDHANNAIRKNNPAAHLDLSGVAKGYAVDQIVELLSAEGHENFLVEVGGEVFCKGYKHSQNAWRVAIERPTAARRDVFRILDLQNRAIATSGDYRNFYIDGGQRYSHSIDPRNGYPINHELASVSVIAATTMQADALSTAMIIMGPEDAFAFVNRHQIAAHFILRSATGKLEEQFSPSFANYIS